MIARILALMLALSFAAGEDATLYSTDRYPIPAKVDGSGVVRPANINAESGANIVSNTRDKFRDGFLSKDATKWVYPAESGSQYVRSRIDGNVAGASYLVVSMPAIGPVGNEWKLISVDRYRVPYEIEYGMTLSQRINGQEINVEMVGVDSDGNVIEAAYPSAVTLSGTISVTSNVWTVNTATAHGVRPGDFIYLENSADSRLNVGPVIVQTAPSTTQLTFTSTLANGTYTPGASAALERIPLCGMSSYMAGIRWWGTSSGNADVVSRNNDPRPRLVAWNPGNTQDATNVPNEGGLNYASVNYVQPFRTKGSWHFEHTSKRLTWRARDIDTNSTDRSQSIRREPVPVPDYDYKIRVRVRSLDNLTVPVGSITAASKSGSTTATLTIPNHGLTTADYIRVYGILDQTNFANLTTDTAVASVVDANTITIAFGASATATSYGGFVYRMNGGALPTTENAAVATYAKTADGLRLSLARSTGSWGETIGNTVTPFGLVTAGGVVQSALHGRYRVAYISTGTMELEPLDGQDLTAVPGSPTACGGTVIRNTDLRLHYFRVYDRVRLELDASTAGASIEPLPVNVLAAPSTTVTASNLSCNMAQVGGNSTVTGGVNGTLGVGGTVADDSAATGNPVRIGGVVRTDNPTTFVNGDAASLTMTTGRNLVVTNWSIPENTWSYAATAIGIVNTTTAVTLKAAGAASIRNYLTSLSFSHESLTNATEIVVRDGASGTVMWRDKIPATTARGTVVVKFEPPIRGTAATLMEFATLSASGAGAVYVNAQGFQAP